MAKGGADIDLTPHALILEHDTDMNTGSIREYPKGFTDQQKADWPDPTPEMLADPVYDAIWNVIKTWDVNVPGVYSGYCGPTGNHARKIYDAIKKVELDRDAPVPAT